jgi:HEAT repeat protein
LIVLLKDEYKLVKVTAALSLADIGDKRAAAPLGEAVAGESDEETRSQMKEALQRLMAARDRQQTAKARVRMSTTLTF